MLHVWVGWAVPKHSFKCLISVWMWREWSPSHYKQKVDSGLFDETEQPQVYVTQWQASQGWGKWLILLPSHSASYLKSHGYQAKSPVTGKKEKSLTFLKRGERRIWGTTNQWVSLFHLPCLAFAPFWHLLSASSCVYLLLAFASHSQMLFWQKQQGLLVPFWSWFLVSNVTSTGQSLTTTYPLLRMLTRFIEAKFNFFHLVKA